MRILILLLILTSCAGSKEFSGRDPKFTTYVINLDRAPQRLEYMDRLLSYHRMKFERISAIDGYLTEITDLETGEKFLGQDLKNKKISLTQNKKYHINCISALKDKNLPKSFEAVNYMHHVASKPMTAGEMGCTCSHRFIYQKLLNSNDDIAVIFEDDLKVKTTEFPYILSNIIGQLPKNSIAFLDAWGPSIENIKRNQDNRALFINLSHSPQIFGLYAVVIDRNFASHLLKAGDVESYPIDIRVSQEITNGKVGGYLANKRSVSFNGNLGSDINNMGRHH